IDALDFFMDEHDLKNEKDSAGLWFCLFNNNQHDIKVLPFQHWFTTFKTALTAIGNVVMVFCPWNNPTTLTRTWCVFEVFVAIECNARFEVAMTRMEKAAFLEHVKNDKDIMGKLVAEINSASSSTRIPSDRDHIFELIKQGPGFQKLDRMVFAALEAWVVHTLETQILLATTPHKRIQWLIAHGAMQSEKGAYAEAESIFQFAVAVHEDIDDADIRPPVHWRAVMYLAMSKRRQHHVRESWDALFMDALVHQENLLGSSHDHTLETMLRYGSACCHFEDYGFGMGLLFKCHELALEFGRSNIRGQVSLRIGRALMEQRPLEALTWLEDAYSAAKIDRGEYHMQTNSVGFDLARCYSLTCQYASAILLLEKFYHAQLRTLGPVAHATMISLRALSENLCYEGQYENLEDNLLKCYDGFLALKSDGWASDCQMTLGILYLCMGELGRARVAFDSTYSKFKDMFGPASGPVGDIVILRFYVAMECAEDVDSLEKISSLESLIIYANLGTETWAHCVGCFQSIHGVLHMCPACPRYSLKFCQSCVTDKKYEATCSHAPTEWICWIPPARFLHEARLSLLASSAMWTDYTASFRAYQDYCDLNDVSNRVKDVRPRYSCQEVDHVECTFADCLR
ncbi:hypothetical protein As57867_017652, partial [Aphanomyces stellatus]